MEASLTCSRQKFLFHGVPRDCQTLETLTQLQQRECRISELSSQLEAARQSLWDYKNELRQASTSVVGRGEHDSPSASSSTRDLDDSGQRLQEALDNKLENASSRSARLAVGPPSLLDSSSVVRLQRRPSVPCVRSDRAFRSHPRESVHDPGHPRVLSSGQNVSIIRHAAIKVAHEHTALQRKVASAHIPAMTSKLSNEPMSENMDAPASQSPLVNPFENTSSSWSSLSGKSVPVEDCSDSLTDGIDRHAMQAPKDRPRVRRKADTLVTMRQDGSPATSSYTSPLPPQSLANSVTLDRAAKQGDPFRTPESESTKLAEVLPFEEIEPSLLTRAKPCSVADLWRGHSPEGSAEISIDYETRPLCFDRPLSSSNSSARSLHRAKLTGHRRASVKRCVSRIGSLFRRPRHAVKQEFSEPMPQALDQLVLLA